MEAAADSKKTLKVEEKIEGERTETTDYYFDKIGDAVPLSSDASTFDTQSPPCKPLAVSERFGLVFAAHSSGFCVAKTKDVVASAKEIKDKGSGPSLQESSVIDVSIGRVHILALSFDSSILAAVVGGDIHCFQVNSLFQKDEKPFYSCSVNSDLVRDLLWTKNADASFIVLTGNGKLFIGAPQKPLKDVMEEVDAVGANSDGGFVAVARKSTLSIYSSKFNEILHIVLPLDSWLGDTAATSIVKVDTIRWVRSDSIVVGCLQLTEDGEENYLVQVIKSKETKIVDGSSTLVAVDFTDLFAGIIDDIFPSGGGPHLFVDYLEKCELAFVANKKNTDEHIMLFTWLQGDNQVSVLHIERDSWLPRIELQESGDDNLVLGLCIDKSSNYGNVKIKLEQDEQRELPSHCLLLCLTLEGKLIMFNFASIAVSQSSTMASSGLVGDAQDISVVGTSNLREAPSTLEDSDKNSAIPSGSHELDANKTTFGIDEISSKKDLDLSDATKHFTSASDSDGNWRKESVAGKSEEKALADVESHKAGQLGLSSQATFSQFSLKESHVGSLSSVAGENDSTKLDQTSMKSLPDFCKNIAGKTGLAPTQSFPFSSGSTSSGAIPGVSNAKSPFVSPVAARSILPGSVLTSVDNSSKAGSFFGNLSSHPSDTFYSSIGKPASLSQRTPTSVVSMDTPFGDSTLKMQSRESVELQNSIGNNRSAMKGSIIKSFPSEQLNSEQEPFKQYSNVQNMASELDKLLEEVGGFTYACTIAHKSLLDILEEGMKCLSDKSRVFQNLTEERLREVQLLLDKTVQVLAREKHMEGLVRQTTDEQYRDLWNRQMLSSELELKRQNVSNRSQDLVNQMIELQKHFNTLELNLYGESNTVDMFSRSHQSRSTSARQIQSLHTVHSATVSQLAAAQQLSELLSQQMAALDVKSPLTKQENVKKQLFESIGISDAVDSLGSARTRKMVEPSFNKNMLVASSAASRKESRRNLLSSGSHEPETARRRRDSLDRNLANFETPRTTVKRMIVEKEGHSVRSSFFSRDNQIASPSKLEDSITSYPTLLAMEDSSGYKDPAVKHNSETVAASTFNWAGTISEVSQPKTQRSPGLQALQGNHLSATANKSASSSPLSLSFSASLVSPNVKNDTNESTDKCVPTFTEKSKPYGLPLTQDKPGIQKMQPQLSSSPLKGGHIPVSYPEDTPSTAALGGRTPLLGSAHGAQSSPAFGLSSISASCRSAFMLTASTSIKDGTESIEKLAKDVSNQGIQSPSSASSVSSSVAHVKPKDPGTVEFQSMGSFTSSAMEPPKTVLKPPTEVHAETNPASTPQPSQKSEPPPSDGSKFAYFTPSTPASEVSKQEASGSPLAPSRTATPASATIQESTSEKKSVEQGMSPLSSSDSGFGTGGKNASDVPVSHEEEMEEGAPETNMTGGLSLASLGGFGLGSSPTTATKSNPFGPPLTSTSVSLSVPSGELFRPASFSFQSLQPSQQSQPSNIVATSPAFGSGISHQQPPSGSGFGQPGQIGSGQQALGSVLGSFGQSRQIGAGLPSSGFGSPQSPGGFLNTSPGGGFANATATGGFASIRATASGFAAAAASSGGFAAAGASGGGFAGAATGGGGFAGAATGGGGFGGAATGGGGFAGAAAGGGRFGGAAAGGGGFGGAAGGGGGFGVFSNQGTGGFSSLGGGIGGGTNQPSSNLFTQIRK